ncbi:Fis family transcriptional regulator [Rhizobium rhizosphaerae]|uniref:Fis family transcriptional regulator n=1 Tax=Xaviernesmea rhizosphaerae TaxID=1672749 RepID=A0A1Q9AIL3_9HYPH|nr:zf-HC2 domain-containing protein [Xaviernesmea rhizosphaerae]OLP55048.1 Fis family transcriptional regulator [Xaviernesmea rhizosphaerae]OQP85782.1 Fis family transcriptional regulator [Xaviernesmea rhizosphaerae]
MMLTDPILQGDLDAYVDGQLSPERRIQVEAHLAAHPDVAAKVMADLSLRGRLKMALHQGEPAGRQETREAARRLERSLRFSLYVERGRRMAAAAAIVAFAWTATSWLGPFRATEVVASEPPPAHVEEAVRAHQTALLRENMRSQPETRGYDREDIRAATAIVMPTLPDGWKVVDVQIFPSRFGPSVEVSIATADGAQRSLFAVRPGAFSVRPVNLYRIDGAEAADWQIGEVAYALVANQATDTLTREAERLSATLY